MTSETVILPPRPFSQASKLIDGSRLTAYQQLELVANIKRLNVAQVRDHMLTQGMIHPDTSNDFVLGYMHQARLKLMAATDPERAESETFLRQHNMPVI